MSDIKKEKKRFVLEEAKDFSESVLWSLQRQYFEENGFKAWHLGDVPHYVTSNPFIANSYAELIFAFLQDIKQKQKNQKQPLYIVELGAGSGRFAFHLLKRLEHLCRLAGLPVDSFKYILTDFTQINLDFWRMHPGFSSFIENGMLDMAIFDVTQSTEISLQVSKQVIKPFQLEKPLVTIANYLFDSIPQDLFYVEQEQLHKCSVALDINKDPATLSAAEILKKLRYTYHHTAVSNTCYNEKIPDEILSYYAQYLSDTYFFFPAVAMRCLQHLSDLSNQGMMLLTADKGDNRFSSLEHKEPPNLVFHGSFSLTVNYHALAMYCEEKKGKAYFPKHRYESLNAGCLLFVNKPESFLQTRLAYYRFIEEFGPDDIFNVYKNMRQQVADMSFEMLCAYLRLSCYDAHQLSRCLPRLFELGIDMDADQRAEIKNIITKIWDQYFPLGETPDLAHDIAFFFFELDDFETAVFYFTESMRIYGTDTGTLYNIALCHKELGEHELAKPLLQKVLDNEPSNKTVKKILAEYTIQ